MISLFEWLWLNPGDEVGVNTHLSLGETSNRISNHRVTHLPQLHQDV